MYALWGHPYQYTPAIYSSYNPGYYYSGCSPDIHGSTKYPQLFHLLASDTTLLQWDVRQPTSSIHQTTFYQHRHTPATRNLTKKLRIISKAFPWTIDIESQVPITCEVVWAGLYEGLQLPMQDSEWGMLCMKKTRRDPVEAAAKKRRELIQEDDKPLKRVDILGETTRFGGLDKDEEFVKLRLFPGETEVPDTWVVSFRS